MTIIMERIVEKGRKTKKYLARISHLELVERITLFLSQFAATNRTALYVLNLHDIMIQVSILLMSLPLSSKDGRGTKGSSFRKIVGLNLGSFLCSSVIV